MDEAFGLMEASDIIIDGLRIRAFPFSEKVDQFIASHEQVFVVEQNRDGQLRTLLINECEVDPARLTAILHYDGTPITAQFIASEIVQKLISEKRPPKRKKKRAKA